MLILPGSNALSAFRTQRLLSQLQSVDAAITGMTGRYIHFIDAVGEVSQDDKARLDGLLTYGEPFSGAAEGDEFVVIPRFGTISPWASKATDIAHNCGMTHIHRIERGNATFNAMNMRHAAVMGDIGGLAVPWRDRAKTRNNDEFISLSRAGERFAVCQQAVEARLVILRHLTDGVDEMDVAPGHAGNRGIDRLQLRQETLSAEGGKGIGARQNQHGRKSGFGGGIGFVFECMSIPPRSVCDGKYEKQHYTLPTLIQPMKTAIPAGKHTGMAASCHQKLRNPSTRSCQ